MSARDHSGKDGFGGEVRKKADRLRASRRRTPNFWRYLGHVGALGWMLVLPVVLGTILGRALAVAFEVRLLTLVGLAGGLAIGLYTTGWHLHRSLQQQEEDEPEVGDEQ